MSDFSRPRFADPKRTDVLSLGACRCPGTPHEEDLYVHRAELGAGEQARAGDYGWAAGGWTTFLPSETRNRLVELAGVRWNLLSNEVDEKGQPIPMPLTAESVALLDEETRELILARIDSITEDKPLPKARRAPSARTTRASGSRTRKTPTKR